MNAVSLVGRITQDLVLRETQGGNDGPSKYVFFTVATSEFANGNETTNFVPCVAWGHTAENMTKFLRKGSMIGVTGRLSVRSRQENGQYQTIVNVRADRVEFLESKNAQPQPSNTTNTNNFNPKDPFADSFETKAKPSEEPSQEGLTDIDDSILWD